MRHYQKLIVVLWLALVWPGGFQPVDAQAGKRLALVIGNGEYVYTSKLINPLNDAKTVAAALGKLGFQVDGPHYDLSKPQMEQRIKRFGRRARSASAAVVYYAGHGVESGGKNYLIPVDAELAFEADVATDAVALDVILRQINGRRGWRLVILDACRNNPLADQMARPDGTRDIFRGLAPVEPRHQTYVAYAAKDGTKALDQDPDGSPHSPFAAAMLKHLNGSRPLPQLFGAIREDVLKRTDRQQEPWLYGAFGSKPVCLVECASIVKPEEKPLNPTRLEVRYWDSTEACGTVACYRAYLKKYPNGEFTAIANARLAALEAGIHHPPPLPAATTHLTVKTTPAHARVRIMNISPRYAAGIELKPNKAYDLEVSASGYDTYRKKHTLAAGEQVVTIDLKKVQRPTFPTPDMVRIEAGCFQMGSPTSEKGRDDDEKRHRVCVDTFEMGKYEVTFAEYDRFCAATGREKPDDEGWGRENRPVINVNWHDAVAYTRWLSKETGKDYRLPTEAEWEYAARAGTTTAYWWGDELGRNNANCYGCGSRWDTEQTAPVGSFKSNPWGLYDTVGNVWEWTCSKYDEEYGGDEKVCISNNQANMPRSLRGGSWNFLPRGVRSANRVSYSPDSRDDDLGFRLSRSL
ncbi:MAG: hypothetical protein CSA09_02225 [Candidatus Contendobacter odensis]|uniref:Caspase family p20 domain-containing protein n=1 Tax=Candidatus Contendibacter odensensis TaxID=1400860 RepID=A0A2G6PGK7_9GAMM|nr:MAG: hypothetical protein CSA09_02225 [Candidatus Contendobacter odensis]